MTAAAVMVLLWVLVLGVIVLVVAWRTRDMQPPQVRDSDYESTVTHTPPEPTGREVTLPAARVWKDLPPGWVNTIPSRPMPLDEAAEPRP